MGAVAVTGSSYIPIVVPIMAFVAMFFWLGLVFYADGHPGWKPRRKPGQASAPAEADAAPEARRLDAAPGAAPAGAADVAPWAASRGPEHGQPEHGQPEHGQPDNVRAAADAPVGAGR
jgi:hypothetical protein